MLNVLHFPCSMIFIEIQQNTLLSLYRSYYLHQHILNILWLLLSHHFGDVYEAMGAHCGIVVRHYATNRQVAGLIPDGVIGIFQ